MWINLGTTSVIICCCELDSKKASSREMETRFYCYCYLVLVIVMMSFKCATSRPFPPQNTTFSPLPQLQAAAGSSSKQQIKPETGETSTTTNKAQGVGVQEVIGSRPPRCEHRCNGCSPCEATQVPTNHRVGIQFTNYEPEGWKCKCGPSFFTP